MNKFSNMNFSGGSIVVGVISQGDNCNIDGRVSSNQERVDQHYQAAEKALKMLAAEYEKTSLDIQDALAQMEALRLEVRKNTEDKTKGNSILKIVRDNFSWAYPAIKDFAKAAWPLLIPAVGT